MFRNTKIEYNPMNKYVRPDTLCQSPHHIIPDTVIQCQIANPELLDNQHALLLNTAMIRQAPHTVAHVPQAHSGAKPSARLYTGARSNTSQNGLTIHKPHIKVKNPSRLAPCGFIGCSSPCARLSAFFIYSLSP